MKTLELKDICGYLPYGLNVMEGSKIRKVVGIYHGSYDFEEGYSSPENGDIIQSQPILRPMSDLTNEIIHRGETFVPLYKLTTSFNHHKWSDDRFRLEITQDRVVIGVYSKSLDAWGIHATINLTSSKLDKLNEWMFDYRGLIPAGLAIDVNSLPENPYER